MKINSYMFKAKVENEIPVEIMSKLHLVDLAGRYFNAI